LEHLIDFDRFAWRNPVWIRQQESCRILSDHRILYDRIRQSYRSVYRVQTAIFKSLHIFIRSLYTVSVSHRFTPYTVPVYGSCVWHPYASVFHRKRSFTTVHVRPGYIENQRMTIKIFRSLIILILLILHFTLLMMIISKNFWLIRKYVYRIMLFILTLIMNN
jgi:hypothetical protein